MRTRIQTATAFLAIFATCMAGVLQISWWAIVAGACVLALVSLSNHAVAYASLGGGGVRTQRVLLVSTALNAVLTSTAALIVGKIIGRVAGV